MGFLDYCAGRNKEMKYSRVSRSIKETDPYQCIDIFWFTYEHTNLIGVSIKDGLDEGWLWKTNKRLFKHGIKE